MKTNNFKQSYQRFKGINENFDFLISLLDNCKTKAIAESVLKGFHGGLSAPSKMPSHSYSIPAYECKTGQKLAKIKGSTCHGCYALKGNYRFSNVKDAMYNRFKTIGQMLWTESMVLTIAIFENSGYFRWHDSGDLQDVEHLEKIVQIANYLPEISFWLPTREYSIVNDFNGTIPNNLVIRFSAHMNNSYKEIVNKKNSSVVISSESFVNSDAMICEATRKDSNHKCNDCRACWSNDVKIVAYLLH
jgi:hypothetical protein